MEPLAVTKSQGRVPEGVGPFEDSRWPGKGRIATKLSKTGKESPYCRSENFLAGKEQVNAESNSEEGGANLEKMVET